ncbi:MAG: TRAP transporter permease [Bacteroidota bacterium]
MALDDRTADTDSTLANTNAGADARDEGGTTRRLHGGALVAFEGLAAAFSLFYLYTAGFGVISTESHRGMYLLLTLILTFMLYPGSKRPSKERLSLVDFVLIALTAISVGYWMIHYKTHMFHIGEPDFWDTFLGIVAMVLSFEAVRRVLGWPLVVIGLAFVVQLYFGPYLPGLLTHQGFGVARIVEYMYSGAFAIFGSILDVFATYILPFLIFGGFLNESGAGDFFIQLTKALVGRARGGPAKMAVVGSALMGTISGASVANVVATGTFTIPLMKKTGYKPHVAAAIEAAASTGGQFLPPIMGAGAFILCTLTQTPYLTVIKHAVIPALLYFIYVGTVVHLEAVRTGMRGLPKDELPDIRATLARGWPYLPPFVVLVAMLLRGYSPFFAAFWSVISLVVLTMLKKETRMTPRKIVAALASGARSSLSVGSTVGVLGMIMGGISMAGLGVTFSAMILGIAKGSLLITVLLTILAGNIIGMGLPTAASYVVLAILAAPALVQLGVPAIVAHLFCFWMSLTSNITPPVCVSAIAAAGIAGANAMKTGITALKYAAVLYIMPITFVYYPAVLMYAATPIEVLIAIWSTLLGAFALAGALQGYLLDSALPQERIILGIASVCLFVPGMVTDLVGFGLLLAIVLVQWQRKRSHIVAAVG